MTRKGQAFISSMFMTFVSVADIMGYSFTNYWYILGASDTFALFSGDRT